MTPKTRTALLLTTITAVGFIGDVVMYSYGQKKPGGKFKVIFPKGSSLVTVLALGFVTGVITDIVIKQIEKAISTRQELALKALVEKETEKINQGLVAGKNPQGVIWA